MGSFVELGFVSIKEDKDTHYIPAIKPYSVQILYLYLWCW